MTTIHTPTPWEVRRWNETSSGWETEWSWDDVDPIDTDTWPEIVNTDDALRYAPSRIRIGDPDHAAFVIRAVNNHDDLVAALREVNRRLGSAMNRLRGRRPHSNDVSWAKQIINDVEKIATDATRAL